MRKLLVLLAVPFLLSSLALAENKARASTKDAELMVHKAVEYVRTQGKEKALAAFNDPKGPFTYLDLYMVVYDLNGTVIAHGRNAKFVGRNDSTTKDAKGNWHFAHRVMELARTEGKGWVEYSIENPETHKQDDKVAYVERAGDLVLTCGVFKN